MQLRGQVYKGPEHPHEAQTPEPLSLPMGEVVPQQMVPRRCRGWGSGERRFQRAVPACWKSPVLCRAGSRCPIAHPPVTIKPPVAWHCFAPRNDHFCSRNAGLTAHFTYWYLPSDGSGDIRQMTARGVLGPPSAGPGHAHAPETEGEGGGPRCRGADAFAGAGRQGRRSVEWSRCYLRCFL